MNTILDNHVFNYNYDWRKNIVWGKTSLTGEIANYVFGKTWSHIFKMIYCIYLIYHLALFLLFFVFVCVFSLVCEATNHHFSSIMNTISPSRSTQEKGLKIIISWTHHRHYMPKGLNSNMSIVRDWHKSASFSLSHQLRRKQFITCDILGLSGLVPLVFGLC